MYRDICHSYFIQLLSGNFLVSQHSINTYLIVFFSDVDECTDDEHESYYAVPVDCSGPDDQCINTRGGYLCQTVVCPTGFVKVDRTVHGTMSAKAKQRLVLCGVSVSSYRLMEP